MIDNFSEDYFWKITDIVTKVPHGTDKKIKTYAAILDKWQKKINLVSNNTLDEKWLRHFLDSAQILKYLKPESAIMDIGSGAGFPGLVLACFGHHVTLVESDKRKVAFLNEVIRQAGIANVAVMADRIENMAIQKYDYITARALADLNQLLLWTEKFIQEGARPIFLKGEQWNNELTLAKEKWHIEVEAQPSLTDQKSVVLLVKKAVRKTP